MTEPEPQPQIDITSPEGLEFVRNLMISVKGGDPRAKQILLDFMDFGSIVERTKLSTRKDVQRVAFFRYNGRTLFPDNPNDPFSIAAEVIAEASMAKDGFKSAQTVDLFRTTPDMADLKQSIEDAQPQSIRERIFGRRSKE